jgi:hypothetical protein
MHGAQSELVIVGRFLGALGTAAGELSFALLPLGNQVLADLTLALQDLAHWLDENHDKVVEITTGALAGLEQTVRILAPLVATLAKDLDKVAEAVGGWDQAFEIVLAGTLVKALLGIGTAAGEKGAAGKVGLLSTRLTGLNALTIAPIVIPLAIAISQKEKDWISKHLGKAGAALFDGVMTVAGGGLIGGPKAVWDDLTGGGKGGGGSSDAAAPGTQGFTAPVLGMSLKNPALVGSPGAGTHSYTEGAGPGGFQWQDDQAVDIVMGATAQVVAVEDGVIGNDLHYGGDSGRFSGWGFQLIADSGNVYFYKHLRSVTIKNGQRVARGDIVGSGTTTGHLHFARKGASTSAQVLGASIPGVANAQTNPPVSPVPKGGPDPKDPRKKPPAFSGDTNANILPESIRLAMAKAEATPGKADDRTATKRAIAWLKANIGGFTGEDEINAYLELASLLGQLKSLAPKVAKKKTPAAASKASLISARALAAQAVGLLVGDPALASEVPPESLNDAERKLADARKKLGPEIRKLRDELKLGGSAKDVAAIRAQLSQYVKALTVDKQDVVEAAARNKTAFQALWQGFADAAVASLEEMRANYKSPARLLLDTLTAAHDTQALNDALDQANADLATALKGHQADAQSQLDDIRKYVGTAFLTNAIDAAQSAILGGTSQQISGQSILDTLHGLLTAGGNVVDPDEVKNAQKAVEDAKYAIQIAGLQKTADAEERAYNDSIDAQEKAIQTLAANWETYFQALHGNIAAVPGWWIAMLNAMGLTDTATQLAGDTSIGGSPSLALQNVHQQALSGAISTAQMQYLTQGHKLEIPGLASGGAVLKTGLAVVHEGETYSGVNGQVGGGDTVVNVHGNIPRDWIQVEIERASPQIQRNLGVSANRRQRSGRF